MARFLLRFSIALVVFEVAFATLLIDSAPMAGYLSVTAAAASWLLQVFGHDVTATGAVLVGESASLTVSMGCDGLQPIGAMACAFLSFPARWKDRAVGSSIGAGVVFVVNAARVATLFLLVESGSSLFPFVHETLWPALILLVAGASWLLWARRVAPHRESRGEEP